MNKLLLSDLTEYQQSLLTRFAYLNIDFDKFHQRRESQNGITISGLRDILLHPDEPYLGSLRVPHLKMVLSGVEITNLELLEELEAAGLGNLEVIDLASSNKSGFNGICFRDSIQNVGFSFRGTDLKTFSSLATDSLADIEAFLTNHNEQVAQAQALFAEHQSLSAQNFLYGHSLGGFLAESVYLHNHESIANAFVINPLHIDSQSIETDSQLAAFNNPLKFSCFVTGGDYVSSINDPALFANNTHYVRNNDKYINNPIANHLIESASFDEYGAFVECPREVAFEDHTSPELEAAIKFVKQDPVRRFFSKAFLTLRDYFSTIRLYFGNLFKKEEPQRGTPTQPSPLADKSDSFKKLLDPENYPSNPDSNHDDKATQTSVQYEVPTTDSHSDKDEDYVP